MATLKFMRELTDRLVASDTESLLEAIQHARHDLDYLEARVRAHDVEPYHVARIASHLAERYAAYERAMAKRSVVFAIQGEGA